MCLACFSSPAEFLNYWMVKGVKFLSRLLNASCSDVITVPLFFSLPPIRPRPLSSFNTYASWQPVTESARSRWSYGIIEDCEQSTDCRNVEISTSIRNFIGLPVADSPDLNSFSSEINSVPNDCIVPNSTECAKNEAKHTTHAQPASTW